MTAMATRPPLTTAAFLVRHARESPSAVAIETGTERITYRDLAQLVVAGRDWLVRAGVEADQVLGVVLPDRRTHLLVLLAAEALGVTTISLSEDEIGAPARLGRLCDRIVAPTPIPGADPARLIVPDPAILDHAGEERPLDALVHRPRPEALVRLIKSSGTTGLPKVMGMTFRVQQLTLRKNLMDAAPHVLPRPHYLCIYNFSVRGCHSRALLTLQLGGTVYLTGGSAAGEMIAAGVGTYALFLTGDLERFVRWPNRDLFNPGLHIDVIGSAVSARLRQAVETQITPHLTVTYGANEVHHISVVDADNVGRLFPDVRVRIVDDAGKQVAPGETGLIHIRSDTMADGYIDAPALTRAAFVKGWYLTNDIGYQPTPETLVVLGRADAMLNIGGVKIAPDPIEARLKAIPGVRDALVTSIDDMLDTNVMLVAVETEPARPGHDLAAQVGTIVMSYVASFQFLALAAFPRTETGKIRREEVKALYRERASR
ncbi:MAG TPA: class I adenylate-forming enzyme family protein, partial [Rhodopila sp.]|uniref:class I adenylate-forming enzyme family protein n=1 Tax=Rhodopila sp. TaxID=2480087 RepID=UPI002C6B3D87